VRTEPHRRDMYRAGLLTGRSTGTGDASRLVTGGRTPAWRCGGTSRRLARSGKRRGWERRGIGERVAGITGDHRERPDHAELAMTGDPAIEDVGSGGEIGWNDEAATRPAEHEWHLGRVGDALDDEVVRRVPVVRQTDRLTLGRGDSGRSESEVNGRYPDARRLGGYRVGLIANGHRHASGEKHTEQRGEQDRTAHRHVLPETGGPGSWVSIRPHGHRRADAVGAIWNRTFVRRDDSPLVYVFVGSPGGLKCTNRPARCPPHRCSRYRERGCRVRYDFHYMEISSRCTTCDFNSPTTFAWVRRV